MTTEDPNTAQQQSNAAIAAGITATVSIQSLVAAIGASLVPVFALFAFLGNYTSGHFVASDTALINGQTPASAVAALIPYGTSAGTAAQGNDARFPASVTGLRKGAGAGSADTAATPGTDYSTPTGAIDANTLGGTQLSTLFGSGYFTQSGSGAVPRTFQVKDQEIISPTDYGAICNGSSANAAVNLAGWQSAIIKAGVLGARIRMPGGRCMIPANSTITFPAGTTNIAAEGAGSGKSFLQFTGPSTSCLMTFGDTSALSANFELRGIELDGYTSPPTDTSCGLGITTAVHIALDDATIKYFNSGLNITGVFSSSINRLFVTANNQGVTLTGNSSSDPNDITFTRTNIKNNFVYGLLGTNVSEINYFGGSLEEDGSTTGSTSNWGAKFISSGTQGPVAGGFYGTYFEANAGIADVMLEQDAGQSTFNLVGDSFTRLNSAAFTSYNVLLSGTFPEFVNIDAPSFWGTGTYTPSSSTPYISRTNSAASLSVRNPYCSSSTECKSPSLQNSYPTTANPNYRSLFNPSNFELYRESTVVANDGITFAKIAGAGPFTISSSSYLYLPSPTHGGAALGLTAAGTTLATALALTANFNEVTTVASGAGVLLAPFSSGVMRQEVIDAGSNALLIYPPTTGAALYVLDGTTGTLSAGTAYSLGTKKAVAGWCESAALCYVKP